MVSGRWLRIEDGRGRQHAIYLPERHRHQLRVGCTCGTSIQDGVIVHAVLTSAYVPQQHREREH